MLNFTGSRLKLKPESSQYQCQNGAVLAHEEAHMLDCLQIRSEERTPEKGTPEMKSTETSRRPLASSSRQSASESREVLQSSGGAPESPAVQEHLPQEEQGGKSSRATKSSSPKACSGGTHTPTAPVVKTEKKQQRSSSKTISPHRDVTERSTTAAHNYHTEQMNK